jgi:hypothetical protein
MAPCILNLVTILRLRRVANWILGLMSLVVSSVMNTVIHRTNSLYSIQQAQNACLCRRLAGSHHQRPCEQTGSTLEGG